MEKVSRRNFLKGSGVVTVAVVINLRNGIPIEPELIDYIPFIDSGGIKDPPNNYGTMYYIEVDGRLESRVRFSSGADLVIMSTPLGELDND